ncbi:MAG: DsbA family oxidoreductase [Xanthobacteraceae bacterium]
MAAPMMIDVVSDVVCPWCYVGKRRLDRALALRPDVRAGLRWLPFFLDAGVPREGMRRIDYISKKFGTSEKVTPMHQRLIGIGAELGIDFHFEKIEQQPNTLDAHRMIGWAHEAGQAEPVVERLFAMFFTEGADLSNRDVLVEAGRSGGLGAVELRRDLASDRDALFVGRQATAASTAGISGVPFFVFGKKVAVAGAQEVEILSAAMDQALTQSGEPTQAA